jgi:hypothetical protein
LNSPRIGEKVELNRFQNICRERSGKVWKELKNDKNEYKSSLGGRRQKPIGALNSPRIGEKFELKLLLNFCLERSGKVWKQLKKDKNEYKSSLGGRRQKPIGALNSPRIRGKFELKFVLNFCLERSGKVWKELKNDKNEYKSSLGGRRQKPIGALNSPRIRGKFELKFFLNFCLERSGKVWKELKKR